MIEAPTQHPAKEFISDLMESNLTMKNPACPRQTCARIQQRRSALSAGYDRLERLLHEDVHVSRSVQLTMVAWGLRLVTLY